MVAYIAIFSCYSHPLRQLATHHSLVRSCQRRKKQCASCTGQQKDEYLNKKESRARSTQGIIRISRPLSNHQDIVSDKVISQEQSDSDFSRLRQLMKSGYFIHLNLCSPSSASRTSSFTLHCPSSWGLKSSGRRHVGSALSCCSGSNQQRRRGSYQQHRGYSSENRSLSESIPSMPASCIGRAPGYLDQTGQHDRSHKQLQSGVQRARISCHQCQSRSPCRDRQECIAGPCHGGPRIESYHPS